MHQNSNNNRTSVIRSIIGALLCILIQDWAATSVFAQSISIQYSHSPAGVKLRTSFSDSASAQGYLALLPKLLANNGYLAASVDSVQATAPTWQVKMHPGQKFVWSTWQWDSGGAVYFAGWEKMLRANFITPDSALQRALDLMEAQGFPFAQVQLKNMTLDNNQISVEARVVPGVPYRFEGFNQFGELKFSDQFLQHITHLRVGDKVLPGAIKQVDQVLDRLAYAERFQATEFEMLASGSRINLYVKPRRSNVAQLLLGAMPGSEINGKRNFYLSGDAQLLLMNSLGNGETLAANWQMLQPKSPRLQLKATWPYLFKSEFGTEFNFDLFKKDSQFLNIQSRLAIDYELGLHHRFLVYYQLQRNVVSTIDTLYVKQTRLLPDIADFTNNAAGLEWHWQTTNSRLSPSRGFQIMATLAGGSRRIRPSSMVENLVDPTDPTYDYSALYAPYLKSTYVLKMRVNAEYYWPAGKKSVAKLGAHSGVLQAKTLFRNELFQIGGYKLLRGFDEESIYANRYLTATTEYRILAGGNSFFYGFCDFGKTWRNDIQLKTSNRYLAFGAGMQLQNRSSLINLSIAVGKRNDQPFDLRQSKMHIGVVNFF